MIDHNLLILRCTVGKTMEPHKSSVFLPSPPTPSNTPRRSPWGTPPATPPATPSDDDDNNDDDDEGTTRHQQQRRQQRGSNQSNEQQQRLNGAFDSFTLLSYFGNWRSTEATPLVSGGMETLGNTQKSNKIEVKKQ